MTTYDMAGSRRYSGTKWQTCEMAEKMREFAMSARRCMCPKCKAGYHVKNLLPKVEGICDVR